MAKVRISVAPDGSTTIEALDVVGPSCSLLTKDLERALGTVESVELKPEYHRVDAVKVAQ